MRESMSSTSELIQCLAGPIIWAGHFAIMYGAETLFCLYHAGAGGLSFQAFAIAFTAGAIVVLLALMAWQLVRESRLGDGGGSRDGSSFLRKTSIMLGLGALVAMVWAAMPAIMLFPCSPTA